MILGLVMIVTGVYCIATPALTHMSLAWIIGTMMIVDALGSICTWSDRKSHGLADGWSLAEGICSLLLGFALIGSNILQLFMNVAMLYIGAAWITVQGVLRIAQAFRARRNQKQGTDPNGHHWGWILVMGILLTICGVFSFGNPELLLVTVGVCMGVNVMMSGVNLITGAFA